MYLKTLHLRQFRNYPDQQITFHAPKTILVGDNAQGKSNLLEAVELLSTLRSHRTSRDRDLVQEGASLGQITATLERSTGPVEMAIALRTNGRRTVRLNGEAIRRQLDCLGILNSVQFSSLDLDLVRGGPDRRRSWLDSLLVQLEPYYAHLLQQYNQVLRQRNAFLKHHHRENTPTGAPILPDPTQLALWDAQLVAIGVRLIRRRARVLERLAPIAQTWHGTISGRTELLTVRYAPSVAMGQEPLDRDDPDRIQCNFLAQLQERAIAECYQGTTLVGPHRDEVEFSIDGTPARQYGSQGQQRTLVLALKLAELNLIREVIGEPPLLLLDDVLAELDLNRQNQLLAAVQDHFQTLITTTHLAAFGAQWINTAQILSVQAGQVCPVQTDVVLR